jgi:lipoprotein-releasing system permease protein
VLPTIDKVKDVVAVSPFLESEVMMTSQTNLSGVLLRGIDPDRITKVTELERFLENEGGSGSLENLVHPERLAHMPKSGFRPMVTEPLGAEQEKKGGPGSGGGVGLEEEPGAGTKREGVIESELLDVPGEVGKKQSPRPVYPGIIIGAELANNLRLYVGDDVNVVAPLGGMSPAGPIPKSKPFRVAGIFYSGLYEYDNKFAYVTIPVAQQFIGLGDEISGIEVKVDELDAAGPVAQRIRSRLAGNGLKVEDWRERNVNLFSALKLEKLVMFIVLTFIVLVASFSIVTNLNMVVLEKMREIAALKAMGASHWSVLKVFVGAGFYIGFLGALVGVMAGIGICTFLKHVGLPLDPEIYYISELPVRMDPVDIAIVGWGGVFISFLATIYPSILAARLKPVEGMRRHEI